MNSDQSKKYPSEGHFCAQLTEHPIIHVAAFITKRLFSPIRVSLSVCFCLVTSAVHYVHQQVEISLVNWDGGYK